MVVGEMMVLGDMEPKDILTLVIAGWGALLSTYLAVRGILHDRRKIKITLSTFGIDPPVFMAVSVTNIGHRPISIRQIALSCSYKLDKGWTPYQGFTGDLLAMGAFPSSKLPITLSDGQIADFYLPNDLAQDLRKGKIRLAIDLKDSDGHVYSKYDRARYLYNPHGTV